MPLIASLSFTCPRSAVRRLSKEPCWEMVLIPDKRGLYCYWVGYCPRKFWAIELRVINWVPKEADSLGDRVKKQRVKNQRVLMVEKKRWKEKEGSLIRQREKAELRCRPRRRPGARIFQQLGWAKWARPLYSPLLQRLVTTYHCPWDHVLGQGVSLCHGNPRKD